METTRELKHLDKLLASIGGRPATAYKTLTAAYDYGDFSLIIDHIPQDTSKYPARMRASVPLRSSRFPENTFSTRSREIAARDFLARSFDSVSDRYSPKSSGGTDGRITIDRPGSKVLETSAVVVGDGLIEVRFNVYLPTHKGKVSGSRSVELFMKIIPKIVRTGLFFNAIDGDRFTEWIETVEDADALRNMLGEHGLVSFIADGSILTSHGQRKERMSKSGDSMPFESPEELAVTFDLPHRGKVRGMGIPSGITLIVGGGFQGKTTLLKTVEMGVYNHIPGDGRELAVTASDAVGIRSEEGRHIENVDISPFFESMSEGTDTRRFSTESASPAVSQAANIMEALEIGTSLLLIDEDTSAPPIMSRDASMQALIPKDEEPVTTLVDILPVLRDELGVSTIMAVSGSGDYFSCADNVIAMKHFKLRVVTADAKRIASERQTNRVSEFKRQFPVPAKRCPLAHSLEPVSKKPSNIPHQHIKGYVQFGDEFVDLTHVNQLVNKSQARGISRGLVLFLRLMNSSESLKEAVEKVISRIESIGLDTLSNRCMGDLAGFRTHELAAAINRLKKLRVK